METEKMNSADRKIMDGFVYFKKEKFLKNPELYGKLAKAQHPKFVVFACSDSRVSPTHILDFQPGEAFMYRNIANLVLSYDKTSYSSIGAAIEYAVMQLKVENILIVGHSKCGGIERLMSDKPKSSYFIDDWMNVALPAKDKVKQDEENATGKHIPFEVQCEFCEKVPEIQSLKVDSQDKFKQNNS